MHTPSSVEVKMLGNLHVQYTCIQPFSILCTANSYGKHKVP